MFKVISISAAAITLALGVTSVLADHNSAPYDINKPAWHKAKIVQAFAQIPGPGSNVAPSNERPDNTAYLVGNIFDVSPFGPAVVIPQAQLPPGFPLPFITVPAHDDVFAVDDDELRDAFGFWVVPGANAVAGGANQNVKVRPMPENSLAGAPLVYAVKSNGKWLLLTSANVVEDALASGVVAAIPSGPDNGFGGIGWLEAGKKK